MKIFTTVIGGGESNRNRGQEGFSPNLNRGMFCKSSSRTVPARTHRAADAQPKALVFKVKVTFSRTVQLFSSLARSKPKSQPVF